MGLRIISALLFLTFLITCSVSCSPAASYDYNESLNALAQDVADHEKSLENLKNNTLSYKFTKDDICVCFGDSITGLMPKPDDYPTVVANSTGMTVVTAGFGGCRMAVHPSPEYDAFSMYRLADAITTGDWSLQDKYVSKISMSSATTYLNDLKGLDWSKVDIITIAYGTNDINGRVLIDDDSQPLSCRTVSGALRYSIETILQKYPHIKILISTPIYRYWVDEDKDSDERYFNDNKFVDWVDAIIAVADEYHLPYVDLYRSTGFNKNNRLYYFSPTDGVHPNQRGLQIIGNKISAAILENF